MAPLQKRSVAQVENEAFETVVADYDWMNLLVLLLYPAMNDEMNDEWRFLPNWGFFAKLAIFAKVAIFHQNGDLSPKWRFFAKMAISLKKLTVLDWDIRLIVEA